MTIHTPVKTCLFLIFLSLALSSNAQRGYESGFVITNRHDTLFGSVKDRKEGYFSKIHKKVRLRGNSPFPKKYSPRQIQGYQRGNQFYESVWLEVSSKLFETNYRSVAGVGKKHFMKIVTGGYLTYYQWEYRDAESGVIDAIDLFKRDGEDYFIRATQGIFGLRKKSLTLYFSDCQDLVQKIEDRELKTPWEIVFFYNEWREKN